MKKIKILQYFVIGFTALLLFVIFMIRFVGDAGFIHEKLKHIEERADNQETTFSDKLFLQTIYQSMIMVGSWKYPQASELLNHYCKGGKDTFYFDSKQLLANEEVKEAIKNDKNIIIFRPLVLEKDKGKNVHVCKQLYFDFYYAFDVLSIKKTEKNSIIFYDNYFFQSLQAKKYTNFKIGAIEFQLNDGLIHIAYPDALPFISYSESFLFSGD